MSVTLVEVFGSKPLLTMNGWRLVRRGYQGWMAISPDGFPMLVGEEFMLVVWFIGSCVQRADTEVVA